MSGLDVPQRGQVYYEEEPMFEPEGLRKIPVGRDSGLIDASADDRTPPPVVPVPRATVANTGSSAGRHAVPRRAPAKQGRYRLLESRRNQWLNSEFGFVFQFYHLLPEFDVLENVLLPQMVGGSIGNWLSNRGAQAARAHELLDRVGLHDRLRHRPSELSGGERQRVAIARALMSNPMVLFADEPTGNLDGKTGRAIFSLLKDLNEAGQTIVMVTHDRDLAGDADRVVQLADGRVR
ncbi:MAG: ATP-binding cassette domain-containing protein [Phycisphaerae bacterium]|nr:ATP-binding cassette domain-containing protein [Phycisphaerae bacterium]